MSDSNKNNRPCLFINLAEQLASHNAQNERVMGELVDHATSQDGSEQRTDWNELEKTEAVFVAADQTARPAAPHRKLPVPKSGLRRRLNADSPYSNAESFSH